MKMFTMIGRLDVAAWMRGLLSAGISGGASAIVSGLVVSTSDPDHFNPQSAKMWTLVGTMFAANGMVSIAKYLQAQPIPAEKRESPGV
ncbi:MAG TPA: hypothetical protein VGR73_19025 [Bryobacteraceae bacterium]|nr:hypothetical protein [Bryobacteraceae bacterium]